jgi:hypothetical protein
LQNKKYCIFNEEFSKENYEKYLEKTKKLSKLEIEEKIIILKNNNISQKII